MYTVFYIYLYILYIIHIFIYIYIFTYIYIYTCTCSPIDPYIFILFTYSFIKMFIWLLICLPCAIMCPPCVLDTVTVFGLPFITFIVDYKRRAAIYIYIYIYTYIITYSILIFSSFYLLMVYHAQWRARASDARRRINYFLPRVHSERSAHCGEARLIYAALYDAAVMLLQPLSIRTGWVRKKWTY